MNSMQDRGDGNLTTANLLIAVGAQREQYAGSADGNLTTATLLLACFYVFVNAIKGAACQLKIKNLCFAKPKNQFFIRYYIEFCFLTQNPPFLQIRGQTGGTVMKL